RLDRVAAPTWPAPALSNRASAYPPDRLGTSPGRRLASRRTQPERKGRPEVPERPGLAREEVRQPGGHPLPAQRLLWDAGGPGGSRQISRRRAGSGQGLTATQWYARRCQRFL